MSENGVAIRQDVDDTILTLVANGDASKLSNEQKVQYYKARCDAAGLDYRAQPFQFISMNGKLVMYALKAATDQLASKHGIRLEIQNQTTENGMRSVTVRAIAKDGRQTDEIGVVPVENLKGADLANAFMKAVTKAKRRAVLSLCGLGMMDESELETVVQDNPKPVSHFTPEIPQTPVLIEEEPPADIGGPVDDVDAALFPPKAKTEGPKITEAQGKRLYAIWKAAKKEDSTVKMWLLQKYGYASSRDILKSDYEEICKLVVTI